MAAPEHLAKRMEAALAAKAAVRGISTNQLARVEFAQFERDGELDATQLKRWRLKCDVLRVATYYRVTGAHARAHKAKRRAALQARLRAWVALDGERRKRCLPPTARG